MITLEKNTLCLSFDNNALLSALFGPNDIHLRLLEEQLDIVIASRGNRLSITGKKRDLAETILQTLYQKLQSGGQISDNDLMAAIRMATVKKTSQKHFQLQSDVVIKTPLREVAPYTPHQREYIKTLFDKELVLSYGPAGTGKTYLAVAVAVSMLHSHKIERIILCRPAVEAGEKIGFLPGDMKDKVDPYMQPLYDSLYDMMPGEKVQKHIENRTIEIAPLGFMRGRTLKNAVIILDEAQNATPIQMKMFLTRLGENSRMVINGDLSQLDLPGNVKSGLEDALHKLRDIPEVGRVRFDRGDVVRHALVSAIIEAYDNPKH